MININDIITSLTQIYNALDDVEVRGNDNYKRLLFAQQKCSDLKDFFTAVLEKLQAGETQPESSESEQEGEVNGGTISDIEVFE